MSNVHEMAGRERKARLLAALLRECGIPSVTAALQIDHDPLWINAWMECARRSGLKSKTVSATTRKMAVEYLLDMERQ